MLFGMACRAIGMTFRSVGMAFRQAFWKTNWHNGFQLAERPLPSSTAHLPDWPVDRPAAAAAASAR